MKINKKQENSVSMKQVSHVSIPLHLNSPTDNWSQAAEDARLKIKEHQSKIRLLRQAARVFERYAKEGEIWPQKDLDNFCAKRGIIGRAVVIGQSHVKREKHNDSA